MREGRMKRVRRIGRWCWRGAVIVLAAAGVATWVEGYGAGSGKTVGYGWRWGGAGDGGDWQSNLPGLGSMGQVTRGGSRWSYVIVHRGELGAGLVAPAVVWGAAAALYAGAARMKAMRRQQRGASGCCLRCGYDCGHRRNAVRNAEPRWPTAKTSILRQDLEPVADCIRGFVAESKASGHCSTRA